MFELKIRVWKWGGGRRLTASLVAKLTCRNRKRAIPVAKKLVSYTAITTGNDKGKGKGKGREKEPEAEPAVQKRPDTWPGHLQDGKWFCECNKRGNFPPSPRCGQTQVRGKVYVFSNLSSEQR
jgi:hypothetical protein